MHFVKIQYVILFLGAVFSGSAQVKLFDKFADALVLQFPDSAFLITHEIMYRPIEGTYSKGGESSIGNRESRLSVYNLSNGALSAQKEMGVKDSLSDALFLGGNQACIWIYWNKYKSGLQALNPRDLERTMTMGQIYSKLNPPIGLFIDPFPKPLNRFYDYEPVKQRLVITNREGKVFYISTSTFETEPLKQAYNFESKKYYFSNSFDLGGLSFQIDPSGNNYLYVENESLGKLTETKTGLLELAFIMEQDPEKLYRYYTHLDSITTKLAEGEMKQKQKLDVIRNLNALENGSNSNNVPILNTDNQLLAIYKTGTEADATIGIAKLKYNQVGECSVVWKLPVQGMFYNARTAQNTQTYKKLFERNQPDSEFRYFYLIGQHLVVIYLQQIACIDIEQGKILWIRRL